MMIKILKIISEYYQNLYVLLYNLINNFNKIEYREKGGNDGKKGVT